VTDTGIGIDPRRLSAIFEAFEQAERDTAAQFGGLGLGLAICKALVEAHGGSIRAYSAGAGRGATFTVALPLAPESGTAWDAGGSSRASRTSHAEALEAPGSDAVSTEVGR
jgi:signal transduction histidine kinase